jgi:DNA-binding LacI/PurR family transcriptional regulator
MYSNIKKNLPRGTISKVAKKMKVHPSTVWRVIKGESINEKILAEVIKEAERYSLLRQKAQSL